MQLLLSQLIICFFSYCSLCGNIYKTGAITYSLSGGRFGDNMLAYLHAKYASIQSGLPLLYREFPYSDQLVMHEKEFRLSNIKIKNFRKKISFRVGDVLQLKKNKGILYEIPYFPVHQKTEEFFYFDVDWNDQKFKITIQQMCAPRYELQLVTPPQDMLTVCIHIRRDSNGYDLPLLDEVKTSPEPVKFKYGDVHEPLKFAPLSYYVQSLQRLLKLYPTGPVYVHIFTDDNSPARFVKLFTDAIVDNRVIYNFRRSKNTHETNVLEDFFSMTLFDCFIHPESNMSIVASKIGNYRTIIAPSHHQWNGNNLLIDRIYLFHNSIEIEEIVHNGK